MKKFLIGVLTGFINGLMGGGAGLVCVPLLSKIYNDTKMVHAYTVATVLSATIVSAIVYWLKGNLQLTDAKNFIIGGALAAPIGVLLLKKINSKFLKKAFAIFLIYSAIRMMINA